MQEIFFSGEQCGEDEKNGKTKYHYKRRISNVNKSKKIRSFYLKIIQQ
jgi:hypothetical protein